MRNQITSETVLVRNKNIPSVNIDDEIGLLNVETGKYYALNSVGADIWKLLENAMPLNNLINLLISEYEIDRDICMEQVSNFIDQLVQKGIVLIK